jgi:radical SAM protein with 4Fe4S-binding SPASM domain
MGRMRVLSGPIHIHLEIVNACNFQCVYCPQSKQEDHFNIIGKGEMRFSAFQTIVDKIMDTWPIDAIVLTRDGEPLLHPELPRFVAYAANKGLHVAIGSNGSLFTKERVAPLLDSGLGAVKSDFCADKDQYERLRKGGRWEKTYEGYKNLLEYAQQKKLPCHLRLLDLNTYDLKRKEDISKSLMNLRKLFPYPDERISVGPVMMHNALNQSLLTLSTSSRQSKAKYNLCHHPWVEMVIDCQGNVVGCCRDLRSEYIVGNVLGADDLMTEIWNGERMQYLRRSLVKKSPQAVPICSECDMPWGVSYAGRGVAGKIVRFLSV